MSGLPDFLRPFWRRRDGSARPGGTATAVSKLDFSDPFDNLYAFGKLWATYDEKPVYSGFQGLMYARIGDQRLQPLFSYTGFGNFQARILPSGNLRLRGKEVGYFADLSSGEILDSWDNPWTGERVPVFNFLNDRIRGELTSAMPRFQLGDENDQPTLMNDGTALADADGEVPFILPWERVGDQLLLSWDYTHRYRNPVDPQRWPRASTGEFINPSEHFTFSCQADELEDRDQPCARFNCGFSRLSPWWPWMRMGGSGVDGGLFGRMHSHKRNLGFEDIPPAVLDYTERHHAEYLEPCDDWDDGQPLGTWEAYARDMPPEVPS
jgi:hypothetical protein